VGVADRSPLIEAAKNADRDAVMRLLSQRADVNARGDGAALIGRLSRRRRDG
jgi:hypothetical protein